MAVLFIILSTGLGYGLTFLVFATILEKSNDLGNSIGSASRYSNGIAYDISRDDLKYEQATSYLSRYIKDEDRDHAEPPSNGKVEQSPVVQKNIGWNSRFTK